MKMLWYPAFSFLFFCLEPMIKKGHLDENVFRHCYGNFFKVPCWKLVDHSYVWSSFTTISDHIGSSILKDTLKLQLKILQTQISIRATLSCPIIMKLISTKVPAKLALAQKTGPALQRTLHQYGRWHFTYFYTLLFLSKKPNFNF